MRFILRFLLISAAFLILNLSASPTYADPAPPAPAKQRIQFVIKTGSDDLRSDSEVIAILKSTAGKELERVVLKSPKQPAWTVGSTRSITAPVVSSPGKIGQITIQLVSVRTGLLGSDNWNIQSIAAVVLGLQGQKATSLFSASGDPLKRLTASSSTLTVKTKESPVIVWSRKFDQITDKNVLNTLHTDQSQGWAAVLSAWKTGESGDELLTEATLTRDDLKQQIAADQAFLARPAPPLHPPTSVIPSLHTPIRIAPTSSVVLAPGVVRIPPRSPLVTGIGPITISSNCGPVAAQRSYVECDLANRQQQALALDGLIEIVRAYVSLLPPPPATFAFRDVNGATIARTTIHVVPKSESTITSAYHTASPKVADLQVPVGDTVVIMLDIDKRSYAKGLTLTPASGVLQFPTGRTHSPHLTLQAVAPGTVTVQYFGSGLSSAPCSTTSSNWSGYVIPGTPVTGIAGSWVVPTVNAKSPSGKSTTWIGIDGCGEPQLIQTGTEQDMNSGFLGIGSGPSYNAWWQVLPKFGNQQSFSGSTPVFPGDSMTASVVPVGGTPVANTTSSWTLTLADATQGWSVSTTQSFSAPLDQAEWIEEATTWCAFGCNVQELADYGSVTFDIGDTVSIAGGPTGNPNLSAVNAVAMTPSSSGDASNNFSTPSIPDCDTDGFTVVPSPIAPLPPGPFFPVAAYPGATVGTAYSQTIPTLGAGSVSLAAGTLPPGLSFSNGTVSGIPIMVGTFNFTLSATDATGLTGATCTQPVTLAVGSAPPPPVPTFSSVKITILTGNDDLRNDSDLQVDFTGINGWPGNTCLVQGNSGNDVPGSPCTGGTPGDWTGTFANNWNGWSAWSTKVETKTFTPGSLTFNGSGSMILTFSTHNTGCSIPFSGCGTTNDNWDIQAMKVELTGSPVAPNSITILNVGNFNAAHNSGGCFFRIRPPGANDPSSLTVTLAFPPSPAGNGCPHD